MAISLPGSNTSYDFANPQQYAVHLRLTPEVKEALLKAQQQGQQASLQLTGHATDNALNVGGHSFVLSSPIAQERLDVFQLFKQGCLQVGQIQQKTVIKRTGLQVASKQHAQPIGQQQQPLQDQPTKHSKGLLKNGVNLPQIQPVKPPIQHQKPHAEHLNGISHAQKTSGPYAKQPKAHTSHAAGPNAKVPLQQPLNQPKHSVVNGTHPQTDPKLPPAEHPKQASQNAPPGTSLQSAQTALPQKPLKAKHAKGPAPAASSTLSEEVVQQVCAAARIGQKETLLVALLQCKPCKNQVLEAVLKEAEKRVPGFQRLQGESLKRACRSYGEMKPGSKWALQSQYVQMAQAVLDRTQNPSTAGQSQADRERKSGQAQPGTKRKRSEEPQPPQGQGGLAEGAPSSTEEGSDRMKKRRTPEPGTTFGNGRQEEATDTLMPSAKKKKKRLRKAGDMERGSQSEESDRAAPTGLKQSMQAVGLEDSDSEDGAIPGSYLTHHRTDHDRNRLAAAARWPPPGAQQNGVSAVDTQLWQNGVQRMLTADAQPRHATHRDSGRHRHATAAAQPTAKAVYQSPALDSPVGHDRRGMEDDAGPSNHANGAVHAGFKHSGNLTGDLTGLNAQSDDRGSIGAGPHASGPMDETGPAVGKIKLKIRRPVSAASETYDQSWFAEHLVRQPQLQAPIQDLTEWEQCLNTYDAKRVTYFRLHQEIQDLRIKVEGLQQAIQEAPDETERASLQQQFKSYWDKRLHRSQQWDGAFNVLHQELQAMFSSLQKFYDTHAHADA